MFWGFDRMYNVSPKNFSAPLHCTQTQVFHQWEKETMVSPSLHTGIGGTRVRPVAIPLTCSGEARLSGCFSFLLYVFLRVS